MRSILWRRRSDSDGAEGSGAPEGVRVGGRRHQGRRPAVPPCTSSRGLDHPRQRQRRGGRGEQGAARHGSAEEPVAEIQGGRPRAGGGADAGGLKRFDVNLDIG